MLIITCNDQTMILGRDDARDLELKLNVSSKGRLWVSLGDSLFDFHSTGVSAKINVTKEQYDFLEILKTKKN